MHARTDRRTSLSGTCAPRYRMAPSCSSRAWALLTRCAAPGRQTQRTSAANAAATCGHCAHRVWLQPAPWDSAAERCVTSTWKGSVGKGVGMCRFRSS
jgi:hypothetical protein